MSDSKLSYMPRLDGLRGIAISAVLGAHFLAKPIVAAFRPGGFGVILFFVLSGYLITRILMQYKDRNTPVGAAASHFYWRRFLRLTPPYYLAIVAAALFGISGMRSNWWIHVLYLSNFAVGLQGDIFGAGHFWTLCIEEQFYFLWFVVVVVMPRRFLLHSIVASILASSIFRLAVVLLGLQPIMWALLPGFMDSLAFGALIAYAGRSARLAFLERWLLDWRILAFSLVAAILTSWIQDWNIATRLLLYIPANTLFAGCLVRSAIVKGKDVRLDWLTLSPLRYLGRISYGLYVYHIFIADFFYAFWPSSHTWPHMFVILTVSSIAFAALSYKIMEQPVLQFKDRVTGELPPILGFSVESNQSALRE
jgi:peptidoglycan/LPS O-acetylase OafA/YrhL